MHESSLVLSAPGSLLEQIERLVLDSVRSPASKRVYRTALRDFVAWTRSNALVFNKASVQRYRSELEQRGLAPASINLRLSAIRKLANEAMDNGLLDGDIAAGISRVHGARPGGVRMGNWLTPPEAERLLSLPDPTSCKGKRDRVVLALLLGCALRRNELIQVTVEHLQQRDGRWVIADLVGKGGRIRTVPVPNWAKPVVDAWTEAAGITCGRLLRAVDKKDRVTGVGLGAESVFKIVHGYGVDMKLNLKPHDLRRYAVYRAMPHMVRRDAPAEVGVVMNSA
jgi:integrase